MKKIIILILLGISFFACRKDKDIEIDNKTEYPTQTYINTTVKGIVLNDKGVPIEGVRIKVGTSSVHTDINGYFLMQNIKANKNGAIITASKKGFVSQTKTFYPQLNATSFFKFTLHYNKNSIIVHSDEEHKNFGSVFANIKIYSTSFKKDNKPYKGNLLINPFWTNIYDKRFKNKVFTSPVGYDKFFKLQGLKSYGIIGLEILDESGEKRIEIGENNYLTLKLKFDNNGNITGTFPEKIPVWYFDTDKGIWIEKDVAFFDAEKKSYTVKVLKSGYWNFATSFNVKKTQFSLKSANNIKLPFIKTIISDPQNNYFLKLRSNSEGNFTCFLPENKDVEMELYIKNDIVKKSINTQLSDITLDERYKKINVQAGFSDCNDKSVGNGYVTIITSTDSIFYLLDENGRINTDILVKEDDNQIGWFATDKDNNINTEIHHTKIIEDKVFIKRPFICKEPYLIFRFGDERVVMGLNSKDITPKTLFLNYKNDKYNIELGYIEFQGEGTYKNMDYTIKVDNNFNYRIIPDSDYEQLNEIIEYNADGMVRGHLKGKAVFKNMITSEIFKKAELEIDYSARVK